tara:strand:- start:2635 stop:2754 length:120 start_codon:yes stop_codon:yes gene_type:complete
MHFASGVVLCREKVNTLVGFDLDDDLAAFLGWAAFDEVD